MRDLHSTLFDVRTEPSNGLFVGVQVPEPLEFRSSFVVTLLIKMKGPGAPDTSLFNILFSRLDRHLIRPPLAVGASRHGPADCVRNRLAVGAHRPLARLS